MAEIRRKKAEPTPEIKRERARAEFIKAAEAYTPLPENNEKARRNLKLWIAGIVAACALAAAVTFFSRKTELPFSARDLDVGATESARAALKTGNIPQELVGFPEEIRRQIASGERSLYSFRVVDTVDEDGDVVKLTLDGNEIGLVRLGHAGTRFTLPLKGAGTTVLNVQAHEDGGGGVTFGAESSVGQVVGDVMDLGQTRTWILRSK